jgi:hypothetical protein
MDTGKQKHKLLGEYLIEAGLIIPEQLNRALNEQNSVSRRLGEVLVMHGWVEQQTIEYIMTKVVLPERTPSNQRLDSSEEISQKIPEQSEESWLDNLPKTKFAWGLSAKKITIFLLLVITGLTLSSFVVELTRFLLPNYPLRDYIRKLINVDEEYNIPTYYSVLALLLAAILLAIIAQAKKRNRDRYLRHWTALAIIFTYLACDEGMKIHDIVSIRLREILNTRGFLLFAWVIPASILVIIFFLMFLGFLSHLPVKTRNLFILAGTVYVGGAIGLELIGGYIADTYGRESFLFVLETTIEEFLEMLGVVIFIHALMSYMSHYMQGVAVHIDIIDNKKPKLGA